MTDKILIISRFLGEFTCFWGSISSESLYFCYPAVSEEFTLGIVKNKGLLLGQFFPHLELIFQLILGANSSTGNYFPR
jgi:hypothetical protein